MATARRERNEFVHLLWEFKRELAKLDDENEINFYQFANDQSYREELLEKALQLNSRKIKKIVQEIRAIDPATNGHSFGGQVDDAAAVQNNSLALELGSIAEKANQQRRSPMTLIIWVLLVAIVGGAAVYVAMTFGLPQQIAAMTRNIMAKHETVSGSILQSTVWHSDTIYTLQGLVFLEGDATLTIESGTTILGDSGSALIVTRDAKLYARGTESEPIIFTSSQPIGSRQRGDWGGLVLLGNAPLNRGVSHIEGIAENDPRGTFGGSDPTSNCGVLEYVRIEFAGFEIGANNELNGLTLGGCGNASIVRYVQSHRGLDDGIEVFGGTVDMRNIVISGAGDDSLDWDMGWNGRVQFLVVQQYSDEGDNGFEGDNWKQQPDAEPRSAPTIYNATMIGSRDQQQDQSAMVIRRGSGGTFRNFVITGFPSSAIDVADEPTAALIETGELSFKNMIFYSIGKGGSGYFAAETGDANKDGGFNEEYYFTNPLNYNRFGINPKLPILAFSLDRPEFTPDADSVAGAVTEVASTPVNDGPAGGEFWDRSANYLGAIRPGAGESWLVNWTAFPIN
ncbi:MAG: hypothetical protein V2J55_16665 [Candidatus Competibacteraceae bacterium]|nr:hypothetical protein [Candidatus Competibacteraceae bacterium]